MFHSFHGLINSIDWPALSVWVFLAQLVEHCNTNPEATGSNPVEAPKNFYSGYFRSCLNCDSTAMVISLFHEYSAVHIISFCIATYYEFPVFFFIKTAFPRINPCPEKFRMIIIIAKGEL